MIESAGRSRLLELRRELATARDGRALLDRRREAIVRAVTERLPRLTALRDAARTVLSAARSQLVDAQLELGRSALDAATLAQRGTIAVETTETSVVGVPQPHVAMPAAPFLPRYGPLSASTTADLAAEAFYDALPPLLALAAEETGVRRLRRTLTRTVRRLNALDTIVLPELARAIHDVTAAIEEEERDEAVRRDRWRGGTSQAVNA